jgi:hypothetical protein
MDLYQLHVPLPLSTDRQFRLLRVESVIKCRVEPEGKSIIQVRAQGENWVQAWFW